MQEAFQPDFRSISGGKGPAVKALTRREIPFVPDAEKPAATKGYAALFS